jgi:hypothetical protein
LTSTEFDAVHAGAPETPPPAIEAWQAPPTRAVRLHAGFVASMIALCSILAMAGPLFAMDRYGMTRFAVALLVVALGAGFGAWIGARLRHQRWKLDAEGLWLRTGRLWWRETRVPASWRRWWCIPPPCTSAASPCVGWTKAMRSACATHSRASSTMPATRCKR